MAHLRIKKDNKDGRNNKVIIFFINKESPEPEIRKFFYSTQ